MGHKLFIYFEAQEGGMDSFIFSSISGLTNLVGWMDESCKQDDQSLVDWVCTAEVGEYHEHRKGTAVRLKDV